MRIIDILMHINGHPMSKTQIEPKILKGFRDYLPNQAAKRVIMIDKLKSVFTSFGFQPIDTPALEYSEILVGKGSAETDKQMYRFLDNGGRDISLRFDLTVPLARYAAMHINELGTPFRRYHIAPVWRAEKPQKGRYREFLQCDFDIIGSNSVLADADIISVIYESIKSLNVKASIRLNNRQILNGLLENLQIRDKSCDILRVIDKLDKQGQDAVVNELQSDIGLSKSIIDELLAFLEISDAKLNNKEIIEELKKLSLKRPLMQEGLEQLSSVCNILEASGIGDNIIRVDLSIARGLDYYTGCVFETKLSELPQIGSICSGGRYDNLAALYTKQQLPGVGASIGLDRLLGALEELKEVDEEGSSVEVLVCVNEIEDQGKGLAIANKARAEGLSVELYPNVSKLANQLKYADRRKIRYAVFATKTDSHENNLWTLKYLRSGEQKVQLDAEKLIECLKKG